MESIIINFTNTCDSNNQKSNFGYLPYMTNKEKYPTDINKMPYIYLIQLNLQELPKTNTIFDQN